VAVLAAACLKPFAALAATWNKDGFGAKTAADALKALGAGNPLPSKDVLIEAPQIAETGAMVPIEITSNVPGTTSIAVLIDKNPFPLVGKFDFMEGALPFVKLNVKMNETSDIRVVAEAGGPAAGAVGHGTFGTAEQEHRQAGHGVVERGRQVPVGRQRCCRARRCGVWHVASSTVDGQAARLGSVACPLGRTGDGAASAVTAATRIRA